METEKAIEIISALAKGTNPRTGKELSAKSPYRNPRTIQALRLAVEALEKTVAKKGKQQQPTNAGNLWEPEEDELLVKEFIAGKTAPQLAKMFGRSVWAIGYRLDMHKSIDPTIIRQMKEREL